MDLVELSRALMSKQTRINKAPCWLLTELAVQKGRELAYKYGVDERLVVLSLYLAHTVFSPVWKGDVQKNHTGLSAEFVRPYLNEWGVGREEQSIILNSIQSHHQKTRSGSRVAEVVKNAECYKFVTVEGSLILLHELGLRQVPYEEAVDKVIEKMEQKKELLTLDECIQEAEVSCKNILSLFGRRKQ